MTVLVAGMNLAAIPAPALEMLGLRCLYWPLGCIMSSEGRGKGRSNKFVFICYFFLIFSPQAVLHCKFGSLATALSFGDSILLRFLMLASNWALANRLLCPCLAVRARNGTSWYQYMNWLQGHVPYSWNQ